MDKLEEREMLKAEIAMLRRAYSALHSQVQGYLDGAAWLHWLEFNEPTYAPKNLTPPSILDKEPKIGCVYLLRFDRSIWGTYCLVTGMKGETVSFVADKSEEVCCSVEAFKERVEYRVFEMDCKLDHRKGTMTVRCGSKTVTYEEEYKEMFMEFGQLDSVMKAAFFEFFGVATNQFNLHGRD
jgi:hypothetical protein